MSQGAPSGVGNPRESSSTTITIVDRKEQSASKKCRDTIATIVLLVLFVISACLTVYFSIHHPSYPIIPNTNVSILSLVSLGGTLGFGIGCLVQLSRCVKTYSGFPMFTRGDDIL